VQSQPPAVTPAAPLAPLRGPALVLAAVRSALTYLAISIYVLLVGPPALLAAALFDARLLVHFLGRQGVRLAMITSGIRYRVEGREHDPVGRAAIFCGNHQSNVDAPLLFIVLRPGLRAIFKAEMQKLPVLGRAMLAAGLLPVDRHDPDRARATVDRATDFLKRGDSFMVFPEGTRSRTGELLPFKKGSFVMAIAAQAPVVPVAIVGARAAMSKGSFVIRPVQIRVRIGEPVETAGMTPADREQLITEVRGRIEQMLTQMRPA
jgi:1-acyl-sn-glycerol-3-phosphate acyltransferase